MHGSGRIDDDGAFFAFGQGEADAGDRVTESDGMDRRPGNSENGAHVCRLDFGAFLDMATLGRQVGYTDGGGEVIMLAHPGGSGMAFFDKRAVNRLWARDGWRREVEFSGGENGDLFAASVVVFEVDGAAVGPHKRIGQVGVSPTIFCVQDAGARLIAKAELVLEVAHEGADRVWFIPAGGRVDVQMVKRAGGATVGGTDDQAAKLAGKVFGSEVTGLDEPDLLSTFE